MEKLGKWFLTNKGKSFSAGVSVTAGLCGFLAYLIPQGFCISELKDFYHFYQYGLPKALDPALEKRAAEVLEVSKLKENEKQFQFFTSNVTDIFSAGCVQTHWGAIVGIPNTFNYRTLGDARKNTSVIRNKEIDWDSEVGKQLQKSLLLSEKAQKYGIAREVQRSLIPHVYVYGGLTGTIIIGNFTFCRYVNMFYNLYQRSRKTRFVLYTLMSLFSLTIFTALNDNLTLYLENRVDEKVAALGREYIEGGIEFYQKEIQRNLAIRRLLGHSGEKIYSSTGNINTMIRTPHIPLTIRLDLLNEKLKMNAAIEEIS